MDRQKQEKFIKQLVMGRWEECLSEKNFLAVSSWFENQTAPEVFIRFEFTDSKGKYAAHFGCHLVGGERLVTRLLLPGKDETRLATPETVGDVPIFTVPHHPVWNEKFLVE